MIYYVLLGVSIILSVAKSSVYNAYAKTVKPTLFSTFIFNGATYTVAALVALVALFFSGFKLSLSTVICAFSYAVIVFSLQTISITAMKLGTMTLTTIFVMYGMLIPSLAGPLFWHEPFGILQGVGIVLMAASLWLLKDGKSEGEKSGSVSKKWLILGAVAFFLSGMAGVMEKIHQSTPGKEEKGMFVFVACLFMLLFAFIVSAVTAKSKTNAEGSVKAKTLISFGAISGAVIGLYCMINLTLAGNLDSMIYFPVANGGAMILSVLVSSTVFKERLNKRKLIGVIVGVLGIVCLSIPI